MCPSNTGHSSLQFNKETINANTIRSYQPGCIRIGELSFSGHIIVAANTILDNWDAGTPAALSEASLAAALELQPEILIVGTGSAQTLPDTLLMAQLARRGVGLEIMTTAAACRTYNVLAHEQRAVVAALFNA